jgi:Subtilase family
MDMQGMPKSEMHNTFWRKKQVVVTFHSSTPLVSGDGVNQGDLILKQLNLESQRQKLNAFLAENGLNYTLNFYQPVEYQDSQASRPLEGRRSPDPGAGQKGGGSFNPLPGIYLFGLSKPIQSEFGEVATSIVVFFDFTPTDGGTQPAMSGMMPEMKSSSGSDEASSGSGDDGDGKEPPHNQSPVVRIINTFNKGPKTLNYDRQVDFSGASPNWLCSGTEYIPQGCPLTPPIPVDDACSFWHFHLPLLSPEELRSMTGEGVTVFVLDTLPERDVISHAVTKARDDNLLLFDVSRNVTFNYDIWNYWAANPSDPRIPPLAVGKDVYGRHIAFRMPDHGLFIAGIVHDIAPHARVECIRIMNDYCVGDSNLFSSALQYIQNRMLPGGDLYQRPVVINLSNVMPTIAEAQSAGLDPSTGVPENVLIFVYYSILALVQLGAIVVASAGNEADLRENPSGMRPLALHPAAFGNPPIPINGVIQAIHGVIPVGAVDKNGKGTSYSSYPGPSGIATYGGEVPEVDPRDPPSDDPIVTVCDAVRGIYSAARYPGLSENSSIKQYRAPNDRGWAYWVGTSFATPIISAVAARVLEWKLRGGSVADVPATITGAGGGTQTRWNNLDPTATGVPGGWTVGPMLLAMQECLVMEKDDDD